MGIFLSKKNHHIQQTTLITSIYCDHCKHSFLFNDYYKHIVQCNKMIKNNKNNKNNKNIKNIKNNKNNKNKNYGDN